MQLYTQKKVPLGWLALDRVRSLIWGRNERAIEESHTQTEYSSNKIKTNAIQNFRMYICSAVSVVGRSEECEVFNSTETNPRNAT